MTASRVRRRGRSTALRQALLTIAQKEIPMLHMVTVRHSPESCPGREGNEAIHPCLHALDQLLAEREVRIVGRWADPAAHVNFLVLDAPNAHVIQELFMQSGLFGHATAEIRPVLSMD